MRYILEKDNVIEVNPYAEIKELVQRSDTSHGVYPRAAFMTIFAQHPLAIIRGRLLQYEGRCY